jgi:hypothetical protein
LKHRNNYDLNDILEGGKDFSLGTSLEEGEDKTHEAEESPKLSPILSTASAAPQQGLQEELQRQKELVKSLETKLASLESQVQVSSTQPETSNDSEAKSDLVTSEDNELEKENDELRVLNQSLELEIEKRDFVIKGLIQELDEAVEKLSSRHLEEVSIDLMHYSVPGVVMSSLPETAQRYIGYLETKIADLKKKVSDLQRMHETELRAMFMEGGLKGKVKKGGGIALTGSQSAAAGMSPAQMAQKIDDLQFQLLYGQTKKDLQISKLEKQIKRKDKELESAKGTLEGEISKLRETLRVQQHSALEQWIFDSHESLTI